MKLTTPDLITRHEAAKVLGVNINQLVNHKRGGVRLKNAPAQFKIGRKFYCSREEVAMLAARLELKRKSHAPKRTTISIERKIAQKPTVKAPLTQEPVAPSTVEVLKALRVLGAFLTQSL
jgi:hypothetical protein